jgi:Amt family ammonium transporter
MREVSIESLAASLAETHTSMNISWVLLCAFLVMFMQAGFALVETGLTRRKNVAHTMAMNYLVYSIGVLGYWAVGFGFQMGGVGAIASLGIEASQLGRELSVTLFGKQHGVLGMTGFMLPPTLFVDGVATLFLFQMMFMDTTCTIPTGALAERWRFAAFMLFSLFIATIIYPVYANWVWGGGFLAQLGLNFGLGHGHVDFAGSSVVHLTGGVLAFLGAKLLGPRQGKFGIDGSVHAIPGHNTPMVVLGTFILAFGWFGFNAGSTLAATDTRSAVVAVNTLLASAAGAMAACLYTDARFGKPDLSMMCNGMLAGLVAITAACAFVSSFSAISIGVIAGILVVVSTLYVEHTLRIDDPVGAISVHGVNGAWGIVALGLFADGSYGDGYNGVASGVRGLLYGDPGQFAASLLGIAANLLYVGSMGTACFLLVGKLVGNRASVEDEAVGLDLSELGMEGYVDDGSDARTTIPPLSPRESARPLPISH